MRLGIAPLAHLGSPLLAIFGRKPTLGKLHEDRCGLCGAWETRPHWADPSQPRKVEWYCAFCLARVREEEARVVGAAALRATLDAIRADVDALDGAGRAALAQHLDFSLPRWRTDFANPYVFGIACAFAVARHWLSLRLQQQQH